MFDLVVHGGDLVDGTGASRRRADLGVVGGRIVAIGDLGQPEAAERVDA
nr:D-aminoacylase [Chloroflexota bacterium]